MAKKVKTKPTGGYDVLMRSLRPQVWEEVVGQVGITKSLTRMFAKGSIRQTMLMHGDRGLGKTTCARLIAARLNCENAKDGDHNPCGKCASCRGIQLGYDDLMVQEIDCGTRNKVDDIKEVIMQAQYGSGDKFRVFILDEAHHITGAGMTALLKATEEPNPNVVWVLCTTEANKIPHTIRSRCVQFEFRPLSDDTMFAYVQSVFDRLISDGSLGCDVESYEEKAIKLIVDRSDGSVRQALALIEQAIMYSDEVTARSIELISGVAPDAQLTKMIDFIVKGKVDDAYAIVKPIFSDTFGNDLLAYLYRGFFPGRGKGMDRRTVVKLIRAVVQFNPVYSFSVNRDGLLFAMYDALHGDSSVESSSTIESKPPSVSSWVKKLIRKFKDAGPVKVVSAWDGKTAQISVGKKGTTITIAKNKASRPDSGYYIMLNKIPKIMDIEEFNVRQLIDDKLLKRRP